jgi:hypothetical protein
MTRSSVATGSSSGPFRRRRISTPLMGVALTSRRPAARDAGLSREQKVTALRIANVPEAEFEAAVEGDNPAGRTP